MYNVILTDEDGHSSILFTSYDLAIAEDKISWILEAQQHPDLLFNSPVYISVRLEKSELISEFNLGGKG